MLKLCSPSLSQVIFQLSSDMSVKSDEPSKSLTMSMLWLLNRRAFHHAYLRPVQ